MTVVHGRLEHLSRGLDYRLVIAAAAGCLAAVLVLAHFTSRQATESFAISWLLPWIEYAVAISLCATLLPLASSPDGFAERIPVSSLYAGVGIAFVFAFLEAGTVGILGTIQAIRIALMSQEVFGLLPAALINGIIIRELLVGLLGPVQVFRTAMALLFLPGPLFPVLSLISPGNERLIAGILFPVAVGCSLGFVYVDRRRRHAVRISTTIAALLGTVVLFYGPVIRGVANSGESAVLSLTALAAFVSLRCHASAVLVAAITITFRQLGLLVLALLAGIAIHHAVGLLWLVDERSSPVLVPLLGIVAMLAFIAFCRHAPHCMAVTYAFVAPFLTAPLLHSGLEAAARVPTWDSFSGAPGKLARLGDLPNRHWIELDSLGPFTPRRRQHSGAGFDSKRGQLVILGSDTHGFDWDMAVYRFDLQNQEWLRSGAAEPAYTYRVDRLHRRVAGSDRLVPWAMHVYDQLLIDPKQDALWLVSAPLHSSVFIVGPVFDTPWTFDLSHGTWHMQPDDGSPPVFFSAVAVYDAARDTLLASGSLQTAVATIGIGEEGTLKPGRLWELGPSRQHWKPVGGVSPHGRNVSGVFDKSIGALLIFERRRQFLVHRYVTASIAGSDGTWSNRVLTDGNCTHRTEYPAVPSVFLGHLGKTLLIPEGSDGRRRTCLYDANQHSLTDLGITPPSTIGMNFTLAYDPVRGIVLLVTGEPFSGHTARVWALRLASTQAPASEKIRTSSNRS